jgi:hypothetical protein
MIRAININCRKLVNELVPFKASNLEGKEFNGMYVIISYGWYPIFIYKNNVWYENIDGYSRSTKKQISQARPDAETVKLKYEDMRTIYLERK